MKTITVTKKQVIKAIETEPLRLKPAYFFAEKAELGLPYQDDGLQSADLNKHSKLCQVCAVGSVFRELCEEIEIEDLNHVIDPDFHFTLTEYESEDALLETLKYSPLLALSQYFEQTASKLKGQARIRADLINFVEALFPNKFTLTLPEGVKPKVA